MEVATEKDFKQTEAGLIPSDWEVKTLREVALYRRGSFPQPYGLDKWYDEINGLPFVQVYDVDDNKKLKAETKWRISKAAQSMSVFVPKDSIILTIQGSIGRIALTQYDAYVDRTLLIFESFKVPFSKYYFMLSVFLLFEREKQNAPGGIIKTITKEALSSFSITYPLLEEQTAIATALSDADALITSSEKLIAKKQNIKQGAMQKLLQPKEGWVVKKLEEMCSRITTGKLDANAMKLDGEYRFYTCAKNYFYIDQYAFDEEALLVSGNGENVGYVHYYNGKFNAYQRTYVLTGFNQNIRFIKFYLDKYLSKRIDSELNDGNTPYIKMGTLTDMEITLPRDKTEQQHIATILTDMDTELEKLQQQLAKHKIVKQGMMQELLTGRKRLNH
ncbi:MAG: restriction endonuclease subunit S [Flavobacteriales bacterium]